MWKHCYDLVQKTCFVISMIKMETMVGLFGGRGREILFGCILISLKIVEFCF